MIEVSIEVNQIIKIMFHVREVMAYLHPINVSIDLALFDKLQHCTPPGKHNH